MREITHSIYHEPGVLLAGVPDKSAMSFYDRQGLESLIYSDRARLRDTSRLEDQLAVMTSVEGLLSEMRPQDVADPAMNPIADPLPVIPESIHADAS